jgi:molecular chaperone GrpE (heat shock protein)
MVGRSDWRGVIDLQRTELPEIIYDQPTSSGLEIIAKARATTAASLKAKAGEPSDASPPPADPNDEAAKAAAEQEALRKRMEKPPTSTIKIKLPLYLYYIKNGETLLARLPIITGYRESEKADLPDDRRRLQAEAFLKGIQGEILDLVVRRKILDARIRKKIDEGKLDEATTLLDELKKVRSYEGLSAQIQNIERRAESTENGFIPAPVKERINKMLGTTSDLMKNYLQEDIVRELEVKLADKKSGK